MAPNRPARTYCVYCGSHFPADASHNCLEKRLGYPPRPEEHDPDSCQICQGSDAEPRRNSD